VADLLYHCQQIWAKHFSEHGTEDTHTEPVRGSRAWYARNILLAIGAAQGARARNDVSLAMSEAVEVGVWATEAQAKFGPWPTVLFREAQARTNRELGRRGAAAVRQRADERDREILTEAAVYRRKFPDVTFQHSTRSMAKHIARALDMKDGTVRDRLRKHRQR
jgi:hypothetical protein